MPYIQLPDGSYFPINSGQSPEQAQTAAQQMYPESFGNTPGHGIFAAGLSALRGATASGLQGLGSLVGSKTIQDYGAQAAAKDASDRAAYAPTSDADVSSAFQRGVFPGLGAEFEKNIGEPIGGMVGRYVAPVALGAAAAAGAAALAPEEIGAAGIAAIGAGARAAGTILSDTPVEQGENLQRQQQFAAQQQAIGAPAPEQGNPVLASLGQAALLSVMPILGGKGLAAWRALGPTLAEQATLVSRGAITQDVALANLRTTATNMAQRGVEAAGVTVPMVVGSEALRTAQSGEDVTSPAAMARYKEGVEGSLPLALLGAPLGAWADRAETGKTLGAAVKTNQANESMAFDAPTPDPTNTQPSYWGTREQHDAAAQADATQNTATQDKVAAAMATGTATQGDLGLPDVDGQPPINPAVRSAQRAGAYYDAMAQATDDPALKEQYAQQSLAQTRTIQNTTDTPDVLPSSVSDTTTPVSIAEMNSVGLPTTSQDWTQHAGSPPTPEYRAQIQSRISAYTDAAGKAQAQIDAAPAATPSADLTALQAKVARFQGHAEGLQSYVDTPRISPADPVQAAFDMDSTPKNSTPVETPTPPKEASNAPNPDTTGDRGGDAVRSSSPDNPVPAETQPEGVADSGTAAGQPDTGTSIEPDALTTPTEVTPHEGAPEEVADPAIVQRAATAWNAPLDGGDAVNKVPYADLSEAAREKLYALADKNNKTKTGVVRPKSAAFTLGQQKQVMKAHTEPTVETIPLDKQTPEAAVGTLTRAVERSKTVSKKLRAEKPGVRVKMEDPNGNTTEAPANSTLIDSHKNMENVAKVIKCLEG